MEDEQKQPLLKASGNTNDIIVSHHYESINPAVPGPDTGVQFPNSSLQTAPIEHNSNPGIQSNDQVEVHSELKIKLYKRRWYILIIYSLFSGTQGGVWNTWGPISASCEEAFGWNDADISLLANWGPISYIVSAVFFSWMIDVKGLRWACVSSMFLVTAGCGLRCITTTPPAVTWLNHIGQSLNGLAGPVAMSGPPVVSAVWFGPHERATSTAMSFSITLGLTALSFIIGVIWVIGMMFRVEYVSMGQFIAGLGGPGAMGSLSCLSSAWFPPHERTTSTSIAFCVAMAGMSIGFVIGPLLVPDRINPNCTTGNLTFNSHSGEWTEYSYSFQEFDVFDNNSCSNASKDARIAQERQDILHLMYYEFGWSVVIFLAMLIYFPKKPPLPPCITASLKRESFVKGLKDLFTKGQFWLVCFVYGLAIGVLNCWASVLDVDLKPHGINQNEAGWIGFYGTCSGCAASLLMARFADIFSKHMKWIVLVMYILGCGFFTWFSLICNGTAPSSVVVLYLTVIAGMTVLNASVPLLFELSCELTYPIGEGTTNGVLTLVNNIGGLVFLFILMIPNIGTMWMNWALLGSVAICLPVLFLIKDTYKRLEVDETSPSVFET